MSRNSYNNQTNKFNNLNLFDRYMNRFSKHKLNHSASTSSRGIIEKNHVIINIIKKTSKKLTDQRKT